MTFNWSMGTGVTGGQDRGDGLRDVVGSEREGREDRAMPFILHGVGGQLGVAP